MHVTGRMRSTAHPTKVRRLYARKCPNSRLYTYRVERFECDEEQRKKKPVAADAQLEKSVYPDQFARLVDPVDGSARQVAPQPEPAHEDREHDAHRERRAPDDLDDHPRPEDFIGETGKTRDEEAGEDEKNGGTRLRRAPPFGSWLCLSGFRHEMLFSTRSRSPTALSATAPFRLRPAPRSPSAPTRA